MLIVLGELWSQCPIEEVGDPLLSWIEDLPLFFTKNFFVLHSSKKQFFEIDWLHISGSELATELWKSEAPHGRISPFDYPAFNEEVEPLLWVEEYTVFCIWSSSYASTFLGNHSRPAMVAIASDVISIVRDLASASNVRSPVQIPILQLLRQLPYRQGLFCIPQTPPNAFNHEELATEAVLQDLFHIVVLKADEKPWNAKLGWDINLKEHRHDWVQHDHSSNAS